MQSSGDPLRERRVIYRGARYKKPDGVIAPTRTHAIAIRLFIADKIRFGRRGFEVGDETRPRRERERAELERNVKIIYDIPRVVYRPVMPIRMPVSPFWPIFF